MSVARCKYETTPTQFIMWMEYLEQDVNAFHREDYYLAQIAAEAARFTAKNPAMMNLKQFLLKFTAGNSVAKEGLDPEQNLKASKSFWKAILGFKRKK